MWLCIKHLAESGQSLDRFSSESLNLCSVSAEMLIGYFTRWFTSNMSLLGYSMQWNHRATTSPFKKNRDTRLQLQISHMTTGSDQNASVLQILLLKRWLMFSQYLQGVETAFNFNTLNQQQKKKNVINTLIRLFDTFESGHWIFLSSLYYKKCCTNLT